MWVYKIKNILKKTANLAIFIVIFTCYGGITYASDRQIQISIVDWLHIPLEHLNELPNENMCIVPINENTLEVFDRAFSNGATIYADVSNMKSVNSIVSIDGSDVYIFDNARYLYRNTGGYVELSNLDYGYLDGYISAIVDYSNCWEEARQPVRPKFVYTAPPIQSHN